MADYPNEDSENANSYSEEEEWQDNFVDEQRDAWEEGGGAYPIAKKDQSLFSLFNDVWKSKDSTKVANINPKTELGDLGLSVRHMGKIAYAADILNEQDVSKYFDSLGEITLATSMSKNGWFTELFVSTKKFAHKQNIGNLGEHAEKKKGWRLFGGKKETATTEQ
jgi:hypothetical protein